MTQWFHANCLFEQMKNPRATRLASVEELEGFDDLPDSDRKLIEGLMSEQEGRRFVALCVD